MQLAPHSGTIWDIYAVEPVMNETLIKAVILKFFLLLFPAPSQISHKTNEESAFFLSGKTEHQKTTLLSHYLIFVTTKAKKKKSLKHVCAAAGWLKSELAVITKHFYGELLQPFPDF